MAKNHYHQGKYRVKNKDKYVNPKGVNNVVYRSSWERMLCAWCDNNSGVKKWGSEEVVVPYINKLDGKPHRYFIDFYLEMENGDKYLVEVKPKAQTKAPERKKGKSEKRLLEEISTYTTNVSKWETAVKYAEKRGARFVIWTEIELQNLGLQLQVSKKFRYTRYANKKLKKHHAGG